VNEQRRQIIQFQEQIKRERTELANKQLLEQRSLKEQLEVSLTMFVEHFSTCMLKKNIVLSFISLNIICSYFHHY